MISIGLGGEDVIVELALRCFRFDPDGVIVKIDRPYAWLEDPGRDLPADIVRLTGITDADVAGKARLLIGCGMLVTRDRAPFRAR